MFMKYRKLGKTDLNLSVIGLGTFQFGGVWGKLFILTEVDKILEQAFELGRYNRQLSAAEGAREEDIASSTLYSLVGSAGGAAILGFGGIRLLENLRY